MSQYDAAATPLYASFTSRPDVTPYVARPSRIDLNAKNTRASVGAAASLALDLSEPDRLTLQDEDTLNRLLWHSIQGKRKPYPGITRSPLFGPQGHPDSAALTPNNADNEDR